ncbi:MAG: hypothetical protein MI866_01965 [Bacteroidales bacterium]|nr:hypothetical protein [Bacteroidales bacterium]
MNIKIQANRTGDWVDALIIDGTRIQLPGIHMGWRFNFAKHSKEKYTYTYALVTKLNPGIIQGCLIYKMQNNEEPYMAYLEVAPHNRGLDKEYLEIAAYLIAYACRLSFKLGESYYKGWLAFDVFEEKKENEIKLMTLYSSKYGAKKFGETTMIIEPEKGEELINKYLK